MFNPIAPYRYLLPTMYLFMADIANPDLFVCGCRTCICLDITRFYEEQRHPSTGPHGRLSQKAVNRAPIAGDGRFRQNLHSSLEHIHEFSYLVDKRWNSQVIRPANCWHLIPSNRFLDGFPWSSQFAAAKLTQYSTMPHRPSDSSRRRQRLLLSGDVHQNPGLATKYPSCCSSFSLIYLSLFLLPRDS